MIRFRLRSLTFSENSSHPTRPESGLESLDGCLRRRATEFKLLWLRSSEVAASDTTLSSQDGTKALGGGACRGGGGWGGGWFGVASHVETMAYPSEVMAENLSSPAWKTCQPCNECGGFHSVFQTSGMEIRLR